MFSHTLRDIDQKKKDIEKELEQKQEKEWDSEIVRGRSKRVKQKTSINNDAVDQK